MAFLSFHVAVRNHTYATCTLDGTAVLHHGVWRPGIYGSPPETIEPQSTGLFGGESKGVFTGVEGRLFYRLSGIAGVDDEVISIWFSNPAVGHPGFFAYRYGDTESSYRLDWGDPGGSEAHIDLDIWLTTAGAAGILQGCNVESLFGNSAAVSKELTLDQMRDFRSGAFRDLPGLDIWWSEFNEAIPKLAALAERDPGLQSAIDQLIGRVGACLSNPDEIILQHDVDHVRTILAHLAASETELSIRFAERGLRILSLLPGRTWSESLQIVSSVRPHADR